MIVAVEELIALFKTRGYELHGAIGLEGREPLSIRNDGFGSGRARQPQVVGFDAESRRIVFGLVRVNREDLDSEDSLEEYNVFLDHNAGLGKQASLVLVLMPATLIADFTAIISHYIHREYWDRIIPVASGQLPGST